VVESASNLSSWEVEEGFQVQGQPRIHRKFRSIWTMRSFLKNPKLKQFPYSPHNPHPKNLNKKVISAGTVSYFGSMIFWQII
jgi:hypothetical protein